MPDLTTQSNYLQVYTTNVDFRWTVDFEKHLIEGSATHTLLPREDGIEEVMYSNLHRILLSLVSIDKINIFPKALTLPIWKSARCWWMNVWLKYVVSLAFRTASIYSKLRKFVLGAKHEVMGSALHVPLAPGSRAGSPTKVAIFYKTTKDSTALQWLAKE